MVRKFLLALAGAGMLSGCVSLGGDSKVPDELITFTPREVATGSESVTDAAGNAIVIYAPEVEDRLDVNRVPVQVSDTGVAYLQDATYIDRPARLFRHLLAETMRARSDRLVIEGEDPGVKARTRVYGRISEAGYDARTSSVVFTFDATVTDTDGKVRQRRFASKIDAVPAKAKFVAPALNEAANDVAIEISDWLVGQPG